MECNRDEALRAKEIAEKKFTVKDLSGAKKFALKAQNLFPALDGISQMISTLDVHIAAEVKFSGEKDWYGIMSLSSMADEDAIRKQYRKLALQLHPDKNKSVGAEGAFQLISEAWNVLSDKNKRMLYDQKRNTRSFQHKVSMNSRKHGSTSNCANGFYNFAKNAEAKAREEKKKAAASAAASTASAAPPPTAGVSAPPHNAFAAKPTTFWTSCDRCKMQYEYLKVYINHNLLCPNCRQPFLALETPKPTGGSNPPGRVSSNTDTKNNVVNGHPPGNAKMKKSANGRDFQWVPFSSTIGLSSAAASSTAAAQAASMVHQTFEKVRKEREEAQAAAKRRDVKQEVHGKFIPTRNANTSVNSNIGNDSGTVCKKIRGMGGDAKEVAPGVDAVESAGVSDFKLSAGSKLFGSGIPAPEGQNDVSWNAWQYKSYDQKIQFKQKFAHTDVKDLLREQLRRYLHQRMDDWKDLKCQGKENELVNKNVDYIGQKRNKMGKNSTEKEKSMRNSVQDIRKEYECDSTTKQDSSEDSGKISSSKMNNTDDGDNNPVSIDVPDPDFHDFDKERSEQCFHSDQMWATYDEEDGMPRYYAYIQKVLSLNPFQLRLSFLTSKSNGEFGYLNWVSSGFTKTCGDFRIGRYETSDTINIFSHKVKWEKGPRGIIKIFPKKGDIWALFRNWSPDWNEHTPDDVIYKYDMVEVIDEYSDEHGISVAPLVKVGGFRTVFKRHRDPDRVKPIPKEEMFRFSHQVPSYELSGQEADDAPRGCYELDPAATPLELLQIIPEFEDLSGTEN